jgi:hypothetical protein
MNIRNKKPLKIFFVIGLRFYEKDKDAKDIIY